MAGFEVFVNGQLAVLYDRLVAEHRQHVSRLQTQVVDLMAQNAVLCRGPSSPRSSADDKLSTFDTGAGTQVGEIETVDNTADSSGSSKHRTLSSDVAEAGTSKKPKEDIPGTVQEDIGSDTEAPAEESGPTRAVSEIMTLPDFTKPSRGGGDNRATPMAWGAPQAPQKPSPSTITPVLPPLGKPQELVLRQGPVSMSQSAGLLQPTPAPSRRTSELPTESTPQPSPSGEKEKRISLLNRSKTTPVRSSIVGQNLRPGSAARPKRKISIMGDCHPDADSPTNAAQPLQSMSERSDEDGPKGIADQKRISFSGTAANPLYAAHDPQAAGGNSAEPAIAPSVKEQKRTSTTMSISSGIDRLSPLKRHSAVDGDLGIRRGSNVNGRRQSNLGGNAGGNLGGNLLTPGEGGARSRADSTVSCVSMFGANYWDNDGGTGSGDAQSRGFRPSRQRMSQLGDKPRLSRLSCVESVDACGNLKFEVAQAWVLGKFGNSMRRSSMGGAARMSQFMDHFLDKDEKEQEQAERRDSGDKYCQALVIHPNSAKHVIWDFFGLILIAYDAVMVPLEIFNPPANDISITMDWIIRMFWTLNILVTFFTGFLKDDGVVEMRPRRIGRHYIITWLPLDIFLSTFDWLDIVFTGIANDGLQRFGASWLRALRMVRSARLIRLLRAPEIAKKITELIPFHEWLGLFATVIKIMLIFLWIAHAVACIFFGVGRYMCNHGRCWIDVNNLERIDYGIQYIVALHWSLSALSGETGVIDPENILERAYAMIVLYLAFVISASYVGSITTTMTNIHMMASEQSSKLSVLRRFLLDHGISRTLAVRVQRNAQHAMIEHKSRAPESSVELLSMISQPLLVEVHYEIYSKGLMVHPFFHCYERVNPAGIRKICHTAVTMLSLHTKDVLFSDLEVAERPRTFFIVSGKLQYMHDMKVSPVLENQWMCEHALWTTWTHAGTARATMETRLLCLDAEKWQETVCTFPTDHACVYAAEFVSWLNADPERARSDMGPHETDITEMLLQAFPAEDEEDDGDEDEHQPPSSREGSFISNLPLPGLAALVPPSQSPHNSARVASKSFRNSYFGTAINILIGSKERQSSHRTRASAHRLATEKHAQCQRRSSVETVRPNQTKNGDITAIAVPIKVGNTLSMNSYHQLSRFAKCRYWVTNCCLNFWGSDDSMEVGVDFKPSAPGVASSSSRSTAVNQMEPEESPDSDSEPEASEATFCEKYTIQTTNTDA